MEFPAPQQALELIKKSQTILIALPKVLTVDAVSAGVALRLLLRNMGKDVTVASSGMVPFELGFLPEESAIAPTVTADSSLTVVLDTSRYQLDELSYNVEDTQVKIFLKPKTGHFSPEDIQMEAGSPTFDLVIALDSQSLDELGDLYLEHAELFMQTPKINIDIKAGNEYFGAVNVIDVTASSITEVVVGLIDAWDSGLLDADIATCILAGMISRTHSFQAVHTTPKTLSLAARLVEAGARQQDIIIALYKTKDFSLLKLWGRLLARITTVPELSLLYSTVGINDFSKTGTTSELLPAVFRELLDNVSGYQAIAVIGELAADRVRIIVAALPHVPLSRIAELLGGRTDAPLPPENNYGVLAVDIANTTIQDAETKLLDAVKAVKQ